MNPPELPSLAELGKREEPWRSRFDVLKSHGYLLRPRYRPGWVPSWKPTIEDAQVHGRFEDAIRPQVRLTSSQLCLTATDDLPCS